MGEYSNQNQEHGRNDSAFRSETAPKSVGRETVRASGRGIDFLRMRIPLTEAPVAVIEELAGLIGNDALLALLTGDSNLERSAFSELVPGAAEDDTVNHIETAPPALTVPGNLGGNASGIPFETARLRQRGAHSAAASGLLLLMTDGEEGRIANEQVFSG